MNEFKFYSQIRVGTPKISRYLGDLHSVYKAIPDTKGCMENIGKEGGCGGWCCKYQSPQLLYCEFLFIWKHISKEWNDVSVCDLFERCMRNAVDENPAKGCVFFDLNTKLCMIHKVRPYNCRIYGITPAEEFNPRLERLRQEYAGKPGAFVRDQCDRVSTVNGSEVTKSLTDQWWVRLNLVEKRIGIVEGLIHDGPGGSYRSPHDHILLYNMPENVLSALAGIRMYDDWITKVEAIAQLANVIRRFYI
jgi:Fe-S-cluster containining protein